MNRVLAIVVSYNSMPWIDRCLGSLAQSKEPVDVIVIDNASKDGTATHIKSCWPDIHLVESEENMGFGRANNIGLRNALKSGYEYVYLMNSDAWIEEDTVAELIQAQLAAPQFGILSPMQLTSDGTSLDRRFAAKCSRYLKNQNPDRVVEVPFVMAAHWLISADALETVGAFSPVFSHYGEDDNFIDRLHYHSFKCGVLPRANAVHDRADRKETRADRMKLKKVSSLVRLSNPSGCFALKVFAELFILAGMALKNVSWEPLAYIPELFGRLPEIRKARIISRGERAFL